MADQPPLPNSPLLSQLQVILNQLEQVIQELDADPKQQQPVADETFERLQSALETLQGMRLTPSAVSPQDREKDALGLDAEWDEVFVDSFPSQPVVPATPQPQADPRFPSVPPPSPRSRQSPGRVGILTAIATGLLGILVGVVLWIGIPSLDFPPLWEQIASRIPSSPVPQSDETHRDLSPTNNRESSPVENGLPPILNAPAPSTAITVAPLPAAPLTPEQSLLAFIQQELADLEGLYSPRLLQRIEPDFPASRLILTIGQNWEQLSSKQQQNLLDSLWQRAQKLSFNQLRLYSPNGHLVARSPVVGQEMVVLQTFDSPD
jgi:hypothetical protein